MLLNDLYINTVLWLVLNYFSYLDQSQICVWGSRHLCFLFHTSCMKEVLNRIRWILSIFGSCPPYSFKGLLTKQVVSQLPFSRPYRSVCSLSMPVNDRLGVIEAAKGYQREQQRLRTERRLAQLGQDQRELELREVLVLFAFIWVLGIVLFFARLYLGPSV